MSGTPVSSFLAGGGGMGALMRAHDWSASPLGLPDAWPAPLRTIVGVMLAANQPMFASWGPERAMLYNDPYAEILGAKHPAALGRPFFEVWHELRDSVGPIMDRAYAGEPSASDHLTISVLRKGMPEEAHFSYFYAPLRDERGVVGGVYCGCVEITARILAERRTAFRLSLEDHLRDLRDPAEVMAVAAGVLASHLGVARAGYAEMDAPGWATVAQGAISGNLPTLAGRHRLADFGPALVADMQAGRTSVVADFADDLRLAPGEASMHRSLGIGAHVIVPLVREGRPVALLFVHSAAPRSWRTDEVATAEDTAERTWVAVERARTEAELRASEAQARFRVELAHALAGLATPAEIMAAVAARIGPRLGVDQANYYVVDGADFVVTQEWRTEASRGLIGRHCIADFGAEVVHTLEAGEVLRVDDASATGSSVTFASCGMGAVLSVPLRRDGCWAGGLHVHTARPRAWTDEEEALLREVAAHAWAAMERARAATELRESEAWLAGLFEQAPTFMTLLHGPEHRFIRANPGYMRLVGGRPVLGCTVAEALPEATEQGFVALLDRVYRTGEPFVAEGIRWAMEATPERPPHEMFVDLAYQPIRDASGDVIGIFVEGADVTERVRVAAALRESDVLGRQILDGATDHAIISTDLGGRVTRWNEGARRILGWTEEEMHGQTLHRVFTPEHVAAGRVEAEMHDALATGRVAAEVPQVRRSGERFPASCALTPLRDEDGKPRGYVKVLRDQTQERRREGRIALLARASAGLLEAPDPDAVLGPLLEEGADLLGYDQAYVYSITPDGAHLSLTHSVGVGDQARASLACVPFHGPLCGIVAETGWPLILSNLLATTEARFAPGRAAGLDAYAGYPVFADGRVVAVIAFGARTRLAFPTEELDLFATLARFLSVVRERLGREAALERGIAERTAELREREVQLQQAQKMEAIGQLTGGLAHDVNNMLQGISGALQMIGRRLESGRFAEVPQLLKAGQEGVDRAAALTHGLLAFARRGHLDATVVIVDEVVGGMADLIRRTVGPEIEVRLQLGDGAWTTLLDRNRLESALLNLAINARDAMPDGGTLTFATRELSLSARELAGEADGVPPGDFVQVSVSDTGEGMPPDVLARVFEPFFTTKPIGRGTGLGLSQLYGFVRQSGGLVRVESAPGKGTTMQVLFPRVEEARPGEGKQDACLPLAAKGGRTILLVEDEPAVRAFAAETLRDQGYAVLEAGDGPSGLAALARAAQVDLLVTDVGLPGLNGRQLADAARERRPALPVLFITGYAGVTLDGGLPPGMEAIAKPFSLDTLANRVAAMLAGTGSVARQCPLAG